MQVRGASTARRFEAGHFCDRESGAFGAQEELSFDLETGSGKAQDLCYGYAAFRRSRIRHFAVLR
jgi:hypothetical protein